MTDPCTSYKQIKNRYFNTCPRIVGGFLFFGTKVFFTFILLSLSASCERKIGIVEKSDIQNLPAQSGRDINIIFTDSGKVQLIVSAPLLEMYDNEDDPHSEFREGIRAVFYEGNPEPVASVTSKYARYIDKKKLWELKDSVVAINEQNYKLETELLFWDQEKDLIYTDRFVKITSDDEIVMGTGFESDPRLTVRKIRKVTATIYLPDEQQP
jgi:LPS export ABC transporter protein LptC